MSQNSYVYLLNRKHDKFLFSIIIIPTTINYVNRNNIISKKTLYTIFGCNLQGKRKYITSLFKEDFDKTSLFYEYFNKIKINGIDNILYAVIPNNKLLKDALNLVYKDIKIFNTFLDTANKIKKYLPVKFCYEIYSIVHDLYIAKDLNEYNKFFIIFKEKFNDFPFMLDLLQPDINNAKSYYEYNYFLRKHIFSFYFCREIDKKLVVISHNKEYFSDINEIIELLEPTIKVIESRMYCSKAEWACVINFLYNNNYKDLIKNYL